MANKQKYIVYDCAFTGISFYTFSDFEDHAGFARNNMMKREDIVSAGFVSGGKCYGRSISLNIASRREEDTKLFQKLFGYTEGEDDW